MASWYQKFACNDFMEKFITYLLIYQATARRQTIDYKAAIPDGPERGVGGRQRQLPLPGCLKGARWATAVQLPRLGVRPRRQLRRAREGGVRRVGRTCWLL